jgi:hypothetical protein
MCVIVDANVAHAVFESVDDPKFGPVQQKIFAKRGRRSLVVVYGGKLRDEYRRRPRTMERILELDRAGKAMLVPSDKLNTAASNIVRSGLCRSDDPHIIALARLSGARVLCSLDKDLHRDFTNSQLVDDPRGRVYQRREHVHLLRETC